MKKPLVKILIFVLSSAVLTMSLSSCIFDVVNEETKVDYAKMPETDVMPVTEADVLNYFNTVLNYLQDSSNFTEKDKPGIKVSTEFSTDNREVLNLSGEEDDKLKPIDESAKQISNRIVSGLEDSGKYNFSPLVFGDMSISASTLIYPYDSDKINITTADVLSAESDIDGSNLNLTITLNGTPEVIEKVYGVPDKQKVISDFNSQMSSYARLDDYTETYVNFEGGTDEEDHEKILDPVYSVIKMSVALEKNDKGTYFATGRINDLEYTVVSDISAKMTGLGSLSDYGSFIVNFRKTENKKYEFDWIGNASFEPQTEETDAKD